MILLRVIIKNEIGHLEFLETLDEELIAVFTIPWESVKSLMEQSSDETSISEQFIILRRELTELQSQLSCPWACSSLKIKKQRTCI
jgi:hypothetical protein